MAQSCAVTLGSTAWFPKELCKWDVSGLCEKARLLSGLPYTRNIPAAGTFVQNFPLHPLIVSVYLWILVSKNCFLLLLLSSMQIEL